MKDLYYASQGNRPDTMGRHKGRMVKDPMECDNCTPVRDPETPWMWRCDCQHSLSGSKNETGPW